MIDLQRPGENGVEAGDGRAAAQSRDHQSSGAGSGATCPNGCSTLPRADLAAESAYAAARGVLHDAAVYAENGGAGFGAPEVGVGDVEVIAGDGDVEVIFEGERDRVVHGNVELAVVHELVDARRVGQVGRLDRRGV